MPAATHRHPVVLRQFRAVPPAPGASDEPQRLAGDPQRGGRSDRVWTGPRVHAREEGASVLVQEAGRPP